jgi:hypothetical protein
VENTPRLSERVNVEETTGCVKRAKVDEAPFPLDRAGRID